jgi:acetylornithine/succinyldiaminopimelate/putrescine aminotransferase
VRGRGLLIGAALNTAGAAIVDRCRDAGLIINCTANTVLRLTPPLTVNAAEIDEALAILERVLPQ